MKDRKKVLLVCFALLLLAGLALLFSRIFLPKEKSDPPMEEEELLAYLAEQQIAIGEEEKSDLFWPDPAE